jgi:type V secretory pathway adhesin AidA
MRRPGGLFWLAIAFVAGIGNYTVKQFVQGLDDELNSVRKKTVAEQKQIHDLTAEWTYLNQPELLADLNKRYLGLVAVTPKQERASIDDLPMRPPPPPDAPPAPLQVATAAPAAPVPAPPPAPAPTPTPAKTAVPVVPVAASTPADVAPPAAQPRPAVPARPKSPSLDALFAQVAGDH